ncbi:TonB-dependent receptor plug domain-containing protein [Draconibacterium mangrovi]|uniref:TonB-dependent receptor plug domain-containing protein n=1 Tax=Draconibacterium mangrovi TaxID=2697469 RepID=UPI001952BF6A|nr:TonB-dependent receptor plug domain-containing protein [Draconibacterium mangrovi]
MMSTLLFLFMSSTTHVMASDTPLFGSLTEVQDQQTTVRGKVVGEEGQPIPGVTVTVKGNSTLGIITDVDGNYQLDNVPGDGTLVFSFVGMKTQEIPVNKRNVIDVTLVQETIGLEEVVAVGYGVQKKSNLTGSISSVNVSDIDNRTVADMNQAIQGKASGVQLVSTSAAPGAESSIRIRGFSSNTTSNPLYVVDGLRVNSISNIDPNVIESIEILKDAASAAIYGAEAGNGVILVTTKKGNIGQGKITYKMQYVIQSYLQKAEVMNAHQ